MTARARWLALIGLAFYLGVHAGLLLAEWKRVPACGVEALP